MAALGGVSRHDGGGFLVHAGLQSSGVLIVVSAYIAAVLSTGAVTLLEFVIPYQRSWQPKWDDVKNDLMFMVTVQLVLPQALTLLMGVTLLRFLELSTYR